MCFYGLILAKSFCVHKNIFIFDGVKQFIIMATLRVLSVEFPEKRTDPEKWFINNFVGYRSSRLHQGVNLESGAKRFLAQLHKTEME